MNILIFLLLLARFAFANCQTSSLGRIQEVELNKKVVYGLFTAHLIDDGEMLLETLKAQDLEKAMSNLRAYLNTEKHKAWYIKSGADLSNTMSYSVWGGTKER